MTFLRLAVLSVLVCGSATRHADAFQLRTGPPAGLLGRESILDMVGSYLDNLASPSCSETERKGPPAGYVYTFKKNGYNDGSNSQTPVSSSGGSYLENLGEVSSGSTEPSMGAYLRDLKEPLPEPAIDSSTEGSIMSSVSDEAQAQSLAPATSGNYLGSLSTQPASFSGPTSSFMYKGATRTDAVSKPGVSSGGYLDNLTTSMNYETPPATSTPQAPASPHAAAPEPQAPALQNAGPTSSQNYMDAMSGSSAAPTRPGGYMYKPSGSAGKRAPSGYLENMASSSNPPQQPSEPAVFDRPAKSVTSAKMPDEGLMTQEPDDEELAVKPLSQWTLSEIVLTVLFTMLFVEIVVFVQDHSDLSFPSFGINPLDILVDLTK
jgi:hypothetical protein